MIEHSSSLSQITNIASQSVFYKSPTPLLIGNLPFGEDFKEKRHEYEYLDYYIVPYDTVEYDGILFYSKFLDNYIFINSTFACWSQMYPSFYCKEGWFCLNPFVNDTNGACSWIPLSTRRDGEIESQYPFCSTSIYYNFEKNRYEKGLGEDVFNYNGGYYPIGAKNLTNGYYGGRLNGDAAPPNEVVYAVGKTVDDVKNWKFDNPVDYNKQTVIQNYPFGMARKFVGNETVSATVDFSNLADRNNLDKIAKEVALSERLLENQNNSYLSTDIKFKMFSRTYNFNSDDQKYFYERLDFVKDLDHEDEPNKFEKVCGLYENNYYSGESTIKFFVGSIVFGNEEHRDDLGWFIGINHAINEEGFFGSSSSSGQDMNRIQSTNVISILRPGANFQKSIENYNLIITLGYAWKSETPKYLVYYCTKDKDKESFYRKYRLYIIDKDPALLFSQRKVWYADLPVEDYGWTSSQNINQPPSLFQYPCYYGYFGLNKFTELEFNYKNLDDENDKKDPIKFSLIGTCRENAQQHLLNFPIQKQFMEHRVFEGYQRVNTFIGYWDAPIVNFKGE